MNLTLSCRTVHKSSMWLDVAAAQNILAKAWAGPSGETLRAFPQGNTPRSPGL